MSETKRHPSLSVVVYTGSDTDLLRRKLESLQAQTLERQAFEILVVDDAPGKEARRVTGAFEGRLPLRVERQPPAGRAARRNHATLMARGEVVLFFDGDGVADPGLLEAHVRAHRSAPAASHAVLGATAVAPALAADPLVQFVTEVEGFPVSYRELRDGDRLDFPFFWGARCSCKRAFLVEHGMFSLALRDGCEDVELGYRLAHRGLDLRYCAGAVTRRTDPMDLEAELAARRRHGASRRALAGLDDPEPLQHWAGVAAAEALWAQVKGTHEALLRSARELDRLARLRSAAGLTGETCELALLHRGYWTALRIAQARGVVEGEAEAASSSSSR